MKLIYGKLGCSNALMLNPLLNPTTLGIHTWTRLYTHTLSHAHTLWGYLRTPESGEPGTEDSITPLGNKDRPWVQKERDEDTVKMCSRAPTQSHLYLLSLVSRAMAGGSVFPIQANPLRGENFGLENKLWGGKCSITGAFSICVQMCVF